MVRSQRGRSFILATIFLFCSVGSLDAASAILHVRATILPYADIDARQQLASYNVAPADLERSYVDLPHSATVNINTNVPVLIITIVPSGRELILAGLSGSNQFANSVEIVLTATERYNRQVTRNLDFRVLLDEESQVGTYALNPLMSVQGY